MHWRRICAVTVVGLTLGMVSPGGAGPGDQPRAPAEQIAVTSSPDDTVAPLDDQPATPEGAASFEKEIRPVLAGECLTCHSTRDGNKLRGGPAVDSRAGLRKGGDAVRVIVPGEPAQSRPIIALRHEITKDTLSGWREAG